jgi:hypothetical protein
MWTSVTEVTARSQPTANRFCLGPSPRPLILSEESFLRRLAIQLPYRHQLDSEIRKGLQSTVKLGLVAEHTNQDGASFRLLSAEVQSLEHADKCRSQLATHSYLVSRARSAPSHNRRAGWLLVARAQTTATSMAIKTTAQIG